MKQNPDTRALYNSDCPVCDSEMRTYNAYSKQTGLPIAFEDLNQIDLSDWGVTEDQATRLLHVMHRGQLYVGYDAMLILWKQMPRFQWLERIGRIPGIYHICDWLYEKVVARIIYERHQRRKARGLISSHEVK